MWNQEAARVQIPFHQGFLSSMLSQPSARASHVLPGWAHQILEFFPIVTNYTADQ